MIFCSVYPTKFYLFISLFVFIYASSIPEQLPKQPVYLFWRSCFLNLSECHGLLVFTWSSAPIHPMKFYLSISLSFSFSSFSFSSFSFSFSFSFSSFSFSSSLSLSRFVSIYLASIPEQLSKQPIYVPTNKISQTLLIATMLPKTYHWQRCQIALCCGKRPPLAPLNGTTPSNFYLPLICTRITLWKATILCFSQCNYDLKFIPAPYLHQPQATTPASLYRICTSITLWKAAIPCFPQCNYGLKFVPAPHPHQHYSVTSNHPLLPNNETTISNLYLHHISPALHSKAKRDQIVLSASYT